MIYAYIRVSTDKQTVENQRFEINRFAKQRDFQLMCGWKKRFQEHGQPKTESLAYY